MDELQAGLLIDVATFYHRDFILDFKHMFLYMKTGSTPLYVQKEPPLFDKLHPLRHRFLSANLTCVDLDPARVHQVEVQHEKRLEAIAADTTLERVGPYGTTVHDQGKDAALRIQTLLSNYPTLFQDDGKMAEIPESDWMEIPLVSDWRASLRGGLNRPTDRGNYQRNNQYQQNRTTNYDRRTDNNQRQDAQQQPGYSAQQQGYRNYRADNRQEPDKRLANTDGKEREPSRYSSKPFSQPQGGRTPLRPFQQRQPLRAKSKTFPDKQSDDKRSATGKV